ncbi:hypothetical protein [Bdellovibrio sp. GT3]|uniref:hypothetical protein n=1 Tax=unclassified Bdellovibrio TaxID=2633795 RepID=UPI0030F3145C
MKTLITALFLSFGFISAAHANQWTHVLTTTITTQSPDYKDILIHNRGTYSQIMVETGSKAHIERIDTISHILWGKQVSGISGVYAAGESKTAYFGPSKVRFLRIYVTSIPFGMPVPVKVWMR